MPRRKKNPRADTEPFRPVDPALPWDSLADLWMRDKTLREITYTEVSDEEWVVGWPGREFAILTPGKEPGTVHVQERSYKGRTQGCPRYDVKTRDMLKLQLGLAAASAHTRDR